MHKILLLIISTVSMLATAQDSIIVAGSYDSTMTYIDFDPDTILPQGNHPFSQYEFDIDMNFDNVVDFKIIARGHAGNGGGIHSVKVFPYNNNQVNYYRTDSVTDGNGTSYYNVSKPYSLGDTIQESDSFTSSLVSLHHYYYYDGWTGFLINDWDSTGESFLGIRLDVDGEYVYGWIRLEVMTFYDAWASVIIKDYALSRFFEPALPAPNNLAETTLFPNPVISDLNIQFPKEVSNCEISIIDNNGKQCLYKTLSNLENVILDLSHLKNGMYTVQINNDGEVRNYKIVKT